MGRYWTSACAVFGRRVVQDDWLSVHALAIRRAGHNLHHTCSLSGLKRCWTGQSIPVWKGAAIREQMHLIWSKGLRHAIVFTVDHACSTKSLRYPRRTAPFVRLQSGRTTPAIAGPTLFHSCTRCSTAPSRDLANDRRLQRNPWMHTTTRNSLSTLVLIETIERAKPSRVVAEFGWGASRYLPIDDTGHSV